MRPWKFGVASRSKGAPQWQYCTTIASSSIAVRSGYRLRACSDMRVTSIAFTVDDLEETRAALVARGVNATEVGEHEGTPSFAFSDPEGRWFAVTP